MKGGRHENRGGRPPRAEAAARGHVTVRLSPLERVQVQEAAAINRQNLSSFLRDAATCAAGDCLETHNLEVRMRCEMLTSIAGPSPYAPRGQQLVSGMRVDLPARIAEAWIAEGYAKPVELKEEQEVVK